MRVGEYMPRPKGAKNKKVVKKDIKAEMAKTMELKKKVACARCQNLRVKSEFYVSYNNPMHPNGIVPYCKSCLQEIIADKDGNVTTDRVQDALQKIDKAFLYDIWKSSLDEMNNSSLDSKRKITNVFGIYIKNLQMPQYRELTWKDSIFLPQTTALNYNPVEVDKKEDLLDIQENKEELLLKWGSSYKAEQIFRLEKFYNEMITTHFITTPQHRQILKFICKLNLKMDECLENDDLGNFTKLSQQYDKLLQTSGLRPIDKTSSNVDIGIKNFSTIFEEVEKDGFIKPAPIEENQDIIDKTIMYILNYTLRLLNNNQFDSPPIDTPKMKEVGVDG